ncbi:hypothetical protein N656DRAFT_780840 [Canariomyces notabilis]|uniref:Pathway-specific nitrogen regulator n=1 Tax=Canariomyces notabilis TaxID=2074819 RepID=A0AAN6QMZ7_9PEZI|nr:hypothetical protein N656DRAFT_780840 [Canariomyces arenarius]
MEDDIPVTQQPPLSDEAHNPTVTEDTEEDAIAANETTAECQPAGDSGDVPNEDLQEHTAADEDGTQADEPAVTEQAETTVTPDQPVTGEIQEYAPADDVVAEVQPVVQLALDPEDGTAIQEVPEDTAAHDGHSDSEKRTDLEGEATTDESPIVENTPTDTAAEEPEHVEEAVTNASLPGSDSQELSTGGSEPVGQAENEGTQVGQHKDVGDAEETTEDANTPRPAYDMDMDAEQTYSAPQPSTFTDRKTSFRTEALIQAAARAVVAKIEKRHSGGSTEHDDDEFEHSFLSTGSHGTHGLGDADQAFDRPRGSSRRESSESQVRHNLPSRSTSGDEGGDSSSHNEPDDDVFSDRSARSSLCSLEANDFDVKTPQAKQHLSRRESFASSRNSPRAVSGLSVISGLSQYDKEHFVPTSRENRMPFRTPSEIRAMQMGSPTPSVFNGSSPRSSRRHAGSPNGILPPISRIGSPTVSTQYSPKGRSTPPRLKVRKEAPLVLLHVTLLPLRWVWGDVLNGLDAINGKVLGDMEQPFEASDQLKTLRDSWRELQDRVGDTVLERGILLPHPQNDYEVLEERLLEALELPLRRRARILECGHYLGPANEMVDDEEESDDEVSQSGRTKEEKRHWCNTCRNEIKYDDLGPGKVFRVKVYASNGLMKAGAWEACWKEMERVDVEVEPIVNPSLQNELEKLSVLQLELAEHHQRQEPDLERSPEPEAEPKQEPSPDLAQHTDTQQPSHFTSPEPEPPQPDAHSQGQHLMPCPPPSAMQLAMPASPAQPTLTPTIHLSPPTFAHPYHDMSEDRRRREEERMREIYGDTMPQPPPQFQPSDAHYPPPQSHSHALTPSIGLLTDHSSSSPASTLRQRHPDSYVAPPMQRSPSEEAYERRERRQQQQHYQEEKREEQRMNGSAGEPGFVELLMEAFKVLLRDPKNVAIIVLCVFLMVLMNRLGQGYSFGNGNTGAGGGNGLGVYRGHEVPVRMEVGGEKVDGKVEVLVEGMAETSRAVEGVRMDDGLVVEKTPALKGEEGEMVSMLLPEEPAPAMQVEEVAIMSHPALEAEAPVEQEALGFTPVEDVFGFATPNADLEVSPSGALEEPDANSLLEAEALAVNESVPADVAAQEVEDQQLLGSLEDPALMAAAELTEASTEEVSAPESDKMADISMSCGAEATPEDTDIPSVVDQPEPTVPLATEPEVSVADEGEGSIPATPKMEMLGDGNGLPNPEQGEPSPIPTPNAEAGSGCDVDADYDYDYDSDHDTDEPFTTTPSPVPSSSEVFVPGPFVTERKTVRVFETVTETVRVSVVTQTETVSTVVTAVPQTVEETVYETETVRITVSVPVNEGGKGEKRRRGSSGCRA